VWESFAKLSYFVALRSIPLRCYIGSLFCLTNILCHLPSRFHFDVSRGPRVLIHCAAVNVRPLSTVFEGDAGNCFSADIQASYLTEICSLLGEVLLVTVNTQYPDLFLSPPPPHTHTHVLLDLCEEHLCALYPRNIHCQVTLARIHNGRTARLQLCACLLSC
jgi:hypothetical protein